MATLQSGKSPGQRIKVGDWLLGSDRGVDTKPVKPRFSVFKSIHLDYGKANDLAVKAVAALMKAERNVGELDVDQDGSLDVLALAHMFLGAPRQNPLAEYKMGTISDIKELAHEKEAKLLLKMSAKAKKHPNAAVKKAGVAMEKAANAVLNGIKPIEGLIKAREAAMRARDAKAPAWEKAFASLKRATRAAEDDGATGLFAALFEVEKPKAKAAKAKPVKDKPKAT